MPILFYLFIYFVGFLHRRSLAFIGWSSTHVLFLDHRGTFCAGGLPNVNFVAATPGTQTPMGAMQTSNANASTTSATPTPQCIVKTPCCRVKLKKVTCRHVEFSRPAPLGELHVHYTHYDGDQIWSNRDSSEASTHQMVARFV